jgi:hypothetical protein
MIVSKELWQRALYILLAVGIFIGGYYFRIWYAEVMEYKIVSVNSPSEITSAITDRWELQLTDRAKGHVRIYDKDILDAIYYQYVARRTYTHEDQIGE